MINNSGEKSSNRDQRVEELLQNNEEPTDDTIQHIREILAGPLEELKALESEIQQVERHLEELKKRRHKVQETITPYNLVLSPIRCLPADILHNIFYHCLPTNRNSLLIATEAPVLLTRICHSWRVTALSSPRLWAQIHITFSDEDLLLEGAQPLTVPRTTPKEISEITNTLRMRCRAIEDWLSRSGTCPLSLSIQYTCAFWQWHNVNTDVVASTSDITSQLVSILTSFSNRWHNVEFDVPFKVFKSIDSQLSASASDLDMLHSLKANFFSGGRLPSDNFNGVAKLALGRNLKRLSIHSLSQFCELPNVPPNWKSITSLSCHSSHTITATTNILRTCPNLVHFMITTDTGLFPDESPPSREIIPLLSLRAIHIVDYAHASFSEAMFANIHAPQLEWIDYTRHSPVGEGENPTIIPLIYQSVALRKLTIFAYAFTTQEMRQILQNAHSITHLVLGEEKRSTDGSLCRTEGLSTHVRLDFGELFQVVGDSFQRPGWLESEGTLLPRLQILEVSNGMPMSLTEDSLLAFITGRMNPSNGLAVMKHVGVTFNHGKGKDIEGPVLRRAQLEGINMKLLLNYRQKTADERYSHPAFGVIDNSDESTWIYHDNEMFEKLVFLI